MMRAMMTRARLCLAIFFSIALMACENGLQIVSFTPDKDISLNQTFTVKVNADVCPANKLNVWLDDNFIKFTPEVKGKYKWISPNTFLFSPLTKLEPIQKYEAQLTSAALFDAKDLPLGDKKIEFSTPDFKPLRAEYFWSSIPYEYYKANIQVNLEFNYPVYLDNIKPNIEVKINGNKYNNVKINSKSDATKLSVVLEKIQQTDIAQNIEVIVKSGAQCIYGKKGLEKDEVFKYSLPAKQELEVSGTASGFDGSSGWLEIAFTQGVDEKTFANFVSYNPAKTVQYAFMDNKVRITGNFENSSSVNVTIRKGLTGNAGGTLKSDFEQDFSFVNLDPAINFADKSGRYLRYNGEKTLEVNAVNVDEVEVEVCQIFKNNLLYYLNQYSYYDSGDYGTSAIDPDNFGKVLYKEKKSLKNNQNWLEKFQVNLQKTIPTNDKGLYIVNVYSTEDRWINSSKTIALTDIGIIAKMSGSQLMVFCNSIETTEPISDVEISLISTNNQTIVSGRTDKEGVLKIDSINKRLNGFQPRLIVAENAQDFNYLDLENTEIETSRFDVAGNYKGSDVYSAYIYGERDLYRPGETARIAAIIRNKQMQVVQDFPVIVKMISPNGALFREFSSNVNPQGGFELAIDLPDYLLTGIYRIELYTASGEYINSRLINVEDFVPDKIRVALKSDKPDYKPGEKVNVYIDAEFLFGAKASGLKWQADFHLVEKQFRSSKFSDFSFVGKKNDKPEIESFIGEGFLNQDGKGTAEYLIPAEATTNGYFDAYSVVNVFDLYGRSVIKTHKFQVFPFETYAGVKMKGSYFGTNQNLSAMSILVDKNGNPIANKNMTMKLIRYEWKTVLKKDYSDKFYYSSEEKQYVEWEKEISSSSSAKETKFAVEKSGRYELQVSEKGMPNYSSYEFYAYGWASSTAGSFEVDKEGRVDIIIDKEKYQAGEKAKVLFTTPFNGKMLVTLERNGVESYQYVNVENRSAEIIFDLKDEYLPNVYVSATLFKKHTPDNSTPFFVAHGYKSIEIEKTENKIITEIITPSEIKPNTTVKVNLNTNTPNSYVTLSAVDEGILQLYNYKTPDPYTYFYSAKPLRTKSFDIYKFLLPEIVKTSSLTGGDDMEDVDYESLIKSRTNPIKTKRFKPFSYWSGIVETNSSGKAEFQIEIPNINSEVRFMAVAYKDGKMGASEKAMKVYNDLIIEPEIPRFLAPEDELIMPVTVINTTGKAISTRLKVSADMAVYLTSADEQSVSIPANSHTTVEFKVKAKNEIGEGVIKFATIGGAKSEEKIEIPVRPVNPYTISNQTGTIKAGETVNLRIPEEYYDGLVQANISISKLYATAYSSILKKLMEYPHGCMEQTISKAFPLIYFGDLASIISPNTFKNSNTIYYISEVINKIAANQRWDGGIAYWTTDENAHYYASVYAAHFLTTAKKANFQVNEGSYQKLLRYISKRAKQNLTTDYRYYVNNKIQSRKIANKELIYSLYVLAMAGYPDVATMNYYKAHQELLTSDTRYLLAGAYAYAGKMNIFNEFTEKAIAYEENARSIGDDFDSYIRSNAIMLYVLADIDPQNPKIPELVRFINSNALEMNKAQSTQDFAFVMLALGKVARGQENSELNLNIYADGKLIKSSQNTDISLNEKEFTMKSISIKATGKGHMHYYFTVSGITKAFVPDYDRNISIRREYLDYKTKAKIDLNNAVQGQILYCKISVNSPQNINNVVISNLLPACLEIENPRLPEVNRATFQSDKMIALRNLDIRDDRLYLFADVPNQYREYYFMVRVTNRGTFSVPAISAEAMYAPADYASLFGRGKATIK